MEWIKAFFAGACIFLFLSGCSSFKREISKVDNTFRFYSNRIYLEKVKDAQLKVSFYWDSNLPNNKIIFDLLIESERGHQISGGQSLILNVANKIYKFSPVSDNLSEIKESLNHNVFYDSTNGYYSDTTDIVREYSVTRQYLLDKHILEDIVNTDTSYYRIKTNLADIEGELTGWAIKTYIKGYLTELAKEQSQQKVVINSTKASTSTTTNIKSKNISPSATIPPTSKMVVSAIKAKVRKSPSKNAEVLYTLKKGIAVTVIGQNKDWVQINFESGRTGWCHKSLLTLKK